MLKLLWVIARKEIVDALRDGKSLATAFVMPIVTALAFAGSIHLVVQMQTESKQMSLPVIGQENAAPLMQRFAEEGIKIVEAPDNPEQAVRDQQWDAIVIIPDGFVEDFREQKTAYIELLSDHSRNEAMSKIIKIKSVIQRWSSEIGALRLITRNVDPNVASVVRIQDINVTSDERVAAKILGGFPMILMLIVFGVGIGMASDIAAGERERKSLESLLINPITHAYAFLGKGLAIFCIAFVISTLGIALQVININTAPLAELGVRLRFGFDTFLLVVILAVPALILATALQLLVSFAARSFKDAQTYNVLIVMAPMVPGVYLMVNSGSAETWQMFVPILGTTALYAEILSDAPLSFLHIVLACMSNLLCTLLVTWMGVAFLQREKTIL